MTTRLIKVPVDWMAFSRFVAARHRRPGVFDIGLAMHGLLTRLFGKRTLQPFHIISPARGKTGLLYGYTPEDARSLRARERKAHAVCREAVRIGEMAIRVMPTTFPPGTRLAFQTRIRPVRRPARDLYDPFSGQTLKDGCEIDAYQHAMIRHHGNGKREITHARVYMEWLAERLDSAAHLVEDECRLFHLARSRAWRGDGRGPEGPDATIKGTLVVDDTPMFADRLVRGIGRHRAYGYGMLLLSRSARTARGA